MHIVIPIGGIGQRFKDCGYNRPKPLIKVMGKEMIFWVLDNLDVQENDVVTIIYNNSLDKYLFSDLIRMRYDFHIQFIPINRSTQGASETIRLGLEQCSEEIRKMKMLSIDCDTFYKTKILKYARESLHNCIFFFFEPDRKPIYSYIKVDYRGFVIDIAEKNPISDRANTGAYLFKSGELFIDYYEKRPNDAGEFYVSHIYKRMIDGGEIVNSCEIKDREFVCLGTPLQVQSFVSSQNNETKEKLRFCFDIDNTLLIKRNMDHTNPLPNKPYIDMCRRLHSLGHTIILYTARSMKSNEGQLGKVMANSAKQVFDVLEQFEIPYDEIYFGKPYAHFYIDDLAVSPFEDLEKTLGFYNTTNSPRNFNTIENGMETIVKRSEYDKIKGEVYYYKNIPKRVQYLFPRFIRSFDNDMAYEVEKINGVPLSYLYTNEQLRVEQFESFIKEIQALHTIKGDIVGASQLFLDKMDRRYRDYPKVYDKYDYSLFNRIEDCVAESMKGYYDESCMIHGDLVFSNVLLTPASQEFKLIDMRGIVRDNPVKYSIYGDEMYDWAKVYQSLIGYEHILTNTPYNRDYTASFLKKFEEILGKNVVNDVKPLTACLIYSMLPLHSDEKHQAFLNLITEWELLN